MVALGGELLAGWLAVAWLIFRYGEKIDNNRKKGFRIQRWLNKQTIQIERKTKYTEKQTVLMLWLATIIITVVPVLIYYAVFIHNAHKL